MDTNKYKETEEARLFAAFSDYMTADIISSGLISSGVERRAVARFVRYYDPAYSDYVARCEAWQMAMCMHWIPGDWIRLRYMPLGPLEDLKVFTRTRSYDWSFGDADPYLLKMLHQVVRIFFKFRGTARSQTDLESVKFRLSRPNGVVKDGTYQSTYALSKQEEAKARDFIKFLIPPSSWSDVRGRFGPGTSADVRDDWQKWVKAPIYIGEPELLELYHLCHRDLDSEIEQRPKANRWFRRGITKIATVPKSLKSDRVVSSEPASLMFAQLALGDDMARTLNTVYGDIVTLDNQMTHRGHLVRAGYTSIDLSDASDHVSTRLVSHILPHWKKFLFSVRSTFAKFPDGAICPLRTFAPMGCGLCFPVLTAVVVALVGSVARRAFWVYGDDIIVHVSDYWIVVQILTKAGLVVNLLKSCPLGIYKEACGVEYLRKLDVTPMLCRDPWEKVDALTLEAHLLRLNRGWYTSPWKGLQRAMVTAWQRAWNLRPPRWSRKNQRWEMTVPMWKSRLNKSKLPRGEFALRRWLTSATDNRNERPDTPYSWEEKGPKPRLRDWQQPIYGDSEGKDPFAYRNEWESIVVKNRSTQMLTLQREVPCDLFPTLLELWLEITNLQSNTKEALQ